MRGKWWYIGGFLLAGLLLVVQFWPAGITGYGKLLPMQMAILQNSDGLIFFSTINFLTGRQEEQCLVQIDRGETMRLRLPPTPSDRMNIRSRDTLAVITSSAADEQLALLQGEWAVARATLEAERSGEKQQIVEGFRQRLELVRVQWEAKKRSHQRVTELYEKGLTTEELLDVSAAELSGLQLQYQATRSDLAAAETGVKPSLLRSLHCRVTALQAQINALEQHKSQLSCIAPFDGRLSTFLGSDTLLTVSDHPGSVLLLPIRMTDREAVQPGATVTCRFTAGRQRLLATVHRIDREIYYLQGQPMVTVVAMLRPPAGDLPDGAVGRCRIAGKPWLHGPRSCLSFLGAWF